MTKSTTAKILSIPLIVTAALAIWKIPLYFFDVTKNYFDYTEEAINHPWGAGVSVLLIFLLLFYLALFVVYAIEKIIK